MPAVLENGDISANGVISIVYMASVWFIYNVITSVVNKSI